ncbi:MAG: hypothetical protein B7C54_05465 [Acidimicrobiales bacterium mtb01]|nr:MAG: hypothetical protein B7C54_05465 [Acidimicrobiales bacterium mtb01]
MVIALSAVLIASACEASNPSANDRLDTAMVDVGSPSRTLAYGPDDEQVLDVYTPAGWSPSDRRPVIVHVHGGGWHGGSRRDAAYLAQAQVRRGWVFVSVDYRLTPGVRFPEPIRDVDRAVRFVRSQASSLGIDPNRLVMSGHSAGGHLAAAVALGDMRPLLVDPTLPADLRAQSSRPNAVVTIGAILDVVAFSDDPWWASGWIVNLLYGCEGSDPFVLTCSSTQMRQGSVLDWLDPRDPSMYVIHGGDDDVVLVEQAWLARARADAVGFDRISLDIVDSGPARYRRHDPDFGANLRELESFLDRVTA